MITILKSIDDKIIEAVQDAYLWLYDRSGIFVGTLVFAAATADVACSGMSTGIRAFDFFFLGYMGLSSACRHYMQGAGQIEALNLESMACRNSRVIRPLFIMLMLSLVVVALIKIDPWKAASALFSLLWMYLLCVLIRDREPKDFFEQHKLARSAT